MERENGFLKEHVSTLQKRLKEAEEFANMAMKLGRVLSAREIADAMAEMDEDNSGTIDRREFQMAVRGLGVGKEIPKDAIDTLFDLYKSGFNDRGGWICDGGKVDLERARLVFAWDGRRWSYELFEEACALAPPSSAGALGRHAPTAAPTSSRAAAATSGPSRRAGRDALAGHVRYNMLLQPPGTPWIIFDF